MLSAGSGDRSKTPNQLSHSPPKFFLRRMASRSPRALALLGFCLVCCCSAAGGAGDGIGVNWGTYSSQKLDPGIVVEMLHANGISRVKLFDVNRSIINAFRGSPIELMIGIPNDQLQILSAFSAAARSWVKQNVTHFIKHKVNIKYVAVGNEPFLRSYNGIYHEVTYPALRNIQQALLAAGLAGKVRATVPMNADVLSAGVAVPSQGTFRPDVAAAMAEIVGTLAEHDSPFTINIYPFLSLQQDPGYPRDFAFFQGTNFPVVDGVHSYSNNLDASYDMLLSALSKLGFPEIRVIVGEIGWPTDGVPNANLVDAQRFNQQLVQHISNGPGTPLSKHPLEVYMFSLLDEDQKSVAPGGFERHWGLFRFDGTAKYPLNLSPSRNRNKFSSALTSSASVSSQLVDAKGVRYLPQRWCVLNAEGNLTNVGSNVNYACTYADCTSLGLGSSCSDIGADGYASFAFNSYYQLNSQDDGSCHFDGLGVITTEDPSLGDCLFRVGIIQSSVPPSKAQSFFVAYIFFNILVNSLF